MSTNIGVTLTADDQQLLAILRSVEGKLDHLAAAANGNFNQTGNAAARAAAQVKNLETQTGMTAKGMNAALRTVPAQFTDIVTSLQGGQPALQVLLQQGGQLKDAFGGILPAAKALGGYVMGMVNPFTLAAAAVAVLTYGFIAGRNESAAHARALIETGNAADITASQLGALSAQLTSTGATQSKAAEAVDLMVRSSVKGADALRMVTEAAINLERAGGQAVAETAKQMAALAKDPVGASRQLADSSAYLTASLYAQIKALQEQGRTTEAAALAQRALADEQARIAPQMEAQLGVLQRLWRGVGDAVASVRDGLLSIGREDGTQQAVEKTAKLLEQARVSLYSRGQVPDLTKELQALEQGAAYEARSAAETARIGEERKAGLKWLDAENGYLSRNQKLGQDILRTINEGNAAGVTREEIERRVAVLRDRADPGINLQQVRDAEAQRLEILRRSQDEISRQRAMGEINDRAQIEATTAITLQTLAVRRDAVAAELAIVSKKQDSEREAAALSGQLALLDAERITAQIKGRNDLAVAIYKQKLAIDAVVRAGQEETRLEQADYFVTESKAREQASLAVYEYTKAVADSGALLDLEGSLLGATRIEREKRLAQFRIEIDLRERLNAIDKTFGSDPAGDIERQRARETAARQIAQIERRAYIDEWQKGWDELADGLTDALMRAFSNAGDGVQALKKTFEQAFARVYLKPMVDNAVKSILGSVQGWLAQAFDAARGGNMASGASGSGSGLDGLLQLFGGNSNSGTMGVIGKLLGSAGGSLSNFFAGSAGSSGVANAALIEAGTAGYGASSGALGGGTAATASSLSSMVSAALPYIAIAVAGSTAAARDFRAGFNNESAKQIGGILGPLAKTTSDLGNVLRGIGISNEASSILSGETLISKLFGRGRPNVEGRNIVGTVGGATGFTGSYNERVREKGGVFRSDKVYTVAGEVSDQIVGAINDMAGKVRDTAKGYAEALGLPASAIQTYTKALDIDVTFGTAEEKAAKIEEALRGYADGLFGTFDSAVDRFKKLGETTEQALARLATLQNFSTDLNALGGVFSRVAGLTVSAREGFIAMAGGMDALRAQAKSFVENYYSRDQVAGVKAREIKDALAAAGITQDLTTKDQFRALVEGVDVTTTQGQQQLATLLQAQGSFADVADYLAEVGGSLATLSQSAPAMGALGGILSAPEQAQLDAINSVTNAVNEVRDAIINLPSNMTTGGAVTYPSSIWETTVGGSETAQGDGG